MGAPAGGDPARAPAVRRLGPRDLAGLCAVAAASGRDPAGAAIGEAAFAVYLDGGCSFVAEADGEAIGYLLAQPISFFDDGPLTVWVDDVAVRPERRRRGVATALYRAFGAWARGDGVRAALTRVAPEDAAARALHRRVGFAPHATGAIVWRFDEG